MPTNPNCARGDGDCSQCSMYVNGDCYQDPEPDYIQQSDADPGL